MQKIISTILLGLALFSCSENENSEDKKKTHFEEEIGKEQIISIADSLVVGKWRLDGLKYNRFDKLTERSNTNGKSYKSNYISFDLIIEFDNEKNVIFNDKVVAKWEIKGNKIFFDDKDNNLECPIAVNTNYSLLVVNNAILKFTTVYSTHDGSGLKIEYKMRKFRE